MDNRLIFVFFPVIIAALWALYNVGRLALQQLSRVRNN
jgi:hypothetical protein